ncbi:hypothetical protein [Tumebacillus lipolyticus]|uniref:Uncharacterized protein n=1 Tax=Tumebacillus lipolyticus TaxID=1280370 RepID=A0ABW4ZTP9_9BACL
MRRNLHATQHTLRPRVKDLLPTTSVLIYGQDSTLFKKTMLSLSRQRNVSLECLLLIDEPNFNLRSLSITKQWPRRFALSLLLADSPCGKSHLVNLASSHITGQHTLVLQAGDRFEKNEIAAMERKLSEAPAQTIGVFGDLQLWEYSQNGDRIKRTIAGFDFHSAQHFLSELSCEHRLAPPLVLTDHFKQHGYPTDYPSEGYLLADTAYVLSLLENGMFEYHPDLCISRYHSAELPLYKPEDEMHILNILLRQTAKELSIKFP